MLRQERAREHRTALRSRPSSAARGARPAQDPGATTTTPAHHSHAATAPCPRPQSRYRGRPPAAAVRCSTTTSRAECRSRRHTAAQSTGASPARLKHRTRPRDKNTAQREKGVRGGGRSQGKQRSAAPPASQARQGGPRGTAPPRSTTHITHQHTSWANSEDSRVARAQGRPSNRKSEHLLRAHRAALRPRLPPPVLRTGPSGCDT